MHRWDKKGSGRGQAALETAPPSRQSSGPHLGRNHCPAHLHPQVAASRVNSPSSYPPARTLLRRWALSGTSRAQKRHGGKTKRERSEKKERAGGGGDIKPSASRTLLAGKRRVPASSPLPNSGHTQKKQEPPARRGCNRRWPARSGGRPGSRARRQREGEGNGRVGWACLARGRARNKAAPLPLPGAGASPGRAARGERAALLRDNGPLPRRRAPGTKARSGTGRPPARPSAKSSGGGRGDGGGRRGLPPVPFRREYGQPPPHVASTPRRWELSWTQRGAGPPAPPPPRAPAADGARLPALLTHPQLGAPAHGGT